MTTQLERGERLISIEVIYAQRVYEDIDILYALVTIIANIINITKVQELLKNKGINDYINTLLKKEIYTEDMNKRIKYIKDRLNNSN